MTESTRAHADAGASTRTLGVRSDAMPHVQGRPALEPVRLTGREGVNSLFEYELFLKTTGAFIGGASAADLDLDSFIGRDISCSIELDGAGVREINALVTDAALIGEVGRHVEYKLTLRPWLHLATLHADCRIFQNLSVVQILDELLSPYAYPVEKRLHGLGRADGALYPLRDYQSQFNESDFAFFERLCQEWGLSYHFEHGQGKHRLVLTDAMAAYRENPSAAYRRVEFHPPGWKIDAEYLHRFVPEHHLTSGRYTTRDHDYTRPRADLTQTRSDPRPTGQADAEVYQWHHGQAGSHYAQPRAGSSQGGGNDPQEEGRHLALLRMQALRSHGARARAGGNLRGMVPGCTFRLDKHPSDHANAEYLILDTVLLLEDVAQETTAQDARRAQRWRVEVDLTAHPLQEPLRPALTRTKPHTQGPQTALVVGPEGQNLWSDELGRIKVQFPWDRLGQKNQHSSCWVRVSSPWAGNQLGGMHLPRIGQEVVVDFIGGDPDLPVCTGRVHNQVNLPPWQLPGQAALSGWRSRELTAQGGGNGAAGRSNHLVLDDTEAKIQAQLKSDHQHSQLSLGHIARIEDNAGRQDERGEGFELRTDGHGAIRARAGLYLSTEAREQARAHVKDMGETVQRLAQAHDRHDALALLAEHHRVQEAGEDQKAVAEEIKAQNDAIRGAGAEGKFPELSQPHLVASSPAGIETTTVGTTHIASGEHTALTSGGHTSIASAKSLLASALEAIRLFAHRAGIRLFAAKGAVQILAQDDTVELIAKRAIELISASDWIRLSAKEGISLEVPGSAFTVTRDKGFEFQTGHAFPVWSSDYQTFGPKSVDQAHPLMPAAAQLAQGGTPGLLEEHFVLLEHAGGLRLPRQKYRIVFDGGRTVQGVTNEHGETDVAQSMVPQFARIEVLRNAEDGVLASYTPDVRTPAEEVYPGRDDPAMEKREKGERSRRSVGGQAHKPNEDEATSRSKAPLHTSCDPNNWGLRMHEPQGRGENSGWDYPVARAYVEAMRPALMGVDWKRATWPLNPADEKALKNLLQSEVRRALGQGAFGLTMDAMPTILIPRDDEAKELDIPDDPNLKGLMRPKDWLLAACKSGIVSVIDAANGGGDVSNAAREFASTLYHEARHAQQDFWIAALLQQHAGDYAHLPHVHRVWGGFMLDKCLRIAAATPLPDEPSARVGLHRMLVGKYYWLLCHYDSVNKRQAAKPGYLADILPIEIPLARKAAYELLQDVGLGGTPIDVDRMARDADGSYGYRMRPWEEDSFACDDVVKALWSSGHVGAVLPRPGFCTRAFGLATHSLQGQSGGATDAH